MDEAALIKDEAFPQFLGCEDEMLQEKAKLLLELLNEGIICYKNAKGIVSINCRMQFVAVEQSNIRHRQPHSIQSLRAVICATISF